VSSLTDVPDVIAEQLAELLANEPRPDVAEVSIDHRTLDTPRLNLWRLLAARWPALLLGVVLVALETASVQVGPLLVQRAIDLGVVRRDTAALTQAGSLYLAATFASAVLLSLRLRWTGRVGQRLITDLRVQVFTHLQRLSHDFFSQQRVGRLLTRMTSDINALAGLLQDGLINLLVQGFTLIIVTAAMFRMDAHLAGLTLAAVAPPMLWRTIRFRAASSQAHNHVRDRISDVLTDLQENIAGGRLVIASNRQAHNAARHHAIVERLRLTHMRAALLHARYVPTVDAIGLLGQLVILLVGGRMVVRGELQIGEFTAFILYLAAFFGPIQQLVALYDQYLSGRAAVGKLDSLLRTPPSVADANGAYALPAGPGAVELDDVTFSYPSGEPVLSGVNLQIVAGETIAFVGPTGAGKSTLARLVMRAYDPTHGAIRIDGHDVRRVSVSSLRRRIGLVPQEPFLFSGTVRQNLLMGAPDSTDSEVQRTADLIGLTTALAEHAAGLDTVIAERGVGLSAGQRQLIALGRALIPRPDIVILDEATSNLDPKSDALVERALGLLLEGRTAIVVAHRLTTAEHADRVAVIADGGVVELGTHAELLAAGGRYTQMYEAWMTQYATEVP
jgi:ATP-binding cassette subfamily B protein